MWWFVALLVGCGSSPGEPADAAVDAIDDAWLEASVDFVVAAPSPVAPPSPPDLTPCAVGWAAQTTDDLTTCAPFGGEHTPSCDGATMALPSSGECVEVSRPCPRTDFGDAEGETLYVKLGATGDGTRASPLGSISGAIAAAPHGATVVVAAGRYDEALTLRDGITLEGVCARDVVLVTNEATATPRIRMREGHATVRHLRIEAESPAVDVESSELALESVIVTRASGVALSVGDGSLDVRRSAVRRVDPSAEASTALHVRTAQARLEEVEIVGASLGASLFEGNLELHDVRLAPSELGVTMTRGSSATLERLVLEGTDMGAIDVLGAGDVTLESSMIRDTPYVLYQGGEDDAAHVHASRVMLDEVGGITSMERGSFTLEDALVTRSTGIVFSSLHEGVAFALHRVRVVDAIGAGLVLSGEDVLADDLDVRGVSPAEDERLGTGRGVEVDQGAAILARVAIADAVANGFLAIQADLDVTDLRVSRTRGMATLGSRGQGVFLYDVTGSLSRVELEENHYCGLSAVDGDTILTDLVVRRTQRNAWERTSCGVDLASTRVGLSRVRVEGIAGVGIVARNTDVRLVDVEIADTAAAPELSALALGAFDETTMTGERVTLSTQAGFGVAVSASVLRLGQARIEDTTRSCPRCNSEDGVGIALIRGSMAMLDDVRVASSAICGVYLNLESRAVLRRSELRANEIALCIDGDASADTSEDVSFADNGQSLSAVSLPVPDFGWEMER